jgi:hypothetical protein
MTGIKSNAALLMRRLTESLVPDPKLSVEVNE